MKLMQTEFFYKGPDSREVRGTYLGRKPATRVTIRRFVAANAVKAGLSPRDFKVIRLGESMKTQWEA